MRTCIRYLIIASLAAAIAAASNGCMITNPDAMKNLVAKTGTPEKTAVEKPSTPQTSPKAPEKNTPAANQDHQAPSTPSKTSGSGLTKPVIPPEVAEEKPKKPIAQPPAALTEEEEVHHAALELAKNLTSVKKIKICLAKTDNEWWVTLYDDIGPLIDLKQYTWNRDAASFTPFLVLKRIPKSRLASHLAAQERDKKCQVIDNPAWKEPASKKDESEKDSKTEEKPSAGDGR